MHTHRAGGEEADFPSRFDGTIAVDELFDGPAEIGDGFREVVVVLVGRATRSVASGLWRAAFRTCSQHAFAAEPPLIKR